MQLEPFVLCVSTLHPHKNIERLIRAYGREKRDYRLVVAGFRGFRAEAIEKLMTDLALGSQVQLTGWIGREELYRLYDRALAFMKACGIELNADLSDRVTLHVAHN